MKIGVISDTHNYFDPKIPELFKGVEHILHAGDVGMPFIVMQLEGIAPVTVVGGNTDSAGTYNETEVTRLAGRKFLVHHIVDVHRPSEILKRAVARENPDVIVFGHSHKPFNQMMGRTLYFNPGYAGKPRFAQPRSIAILHCDETAIRAEFVEL